MGIVDTIFAVTSNWALVITEQCAKVGVPVTEWISDLNDGRTIVEVVGQVIGQLEAAFYKILLGFFLEEATGAYLTAFARGFFQIERLGADTTEGMVVFTNSTLIERTIEVDAMIVGTPGAGNSSKTYRAITGGTLKPFDPKTGTPGTLVIKVRATGTGEEFNVANLAITDIKTPMAGVTVSNVAGPSGTWITNAGRRDEDDGSVSPPLGLKGRCLAKWGIKGAGATADAYRFWAQAPINGGNTSPVTRAEPASDYDPDAGTFRPNAVTVWLAGPAGPLVAADVASVADNFEHPLQRYPLGTKLFVRSSAAVNVDIAGVVYFYLTYQQPDVQSSVAEAIALFQNDARIGATVYKSVLDQKIHDGFPLAIRNIDLSKMPDASPTGPGKIPVFTQKLTFVGVPVN